MSDPRDLIAVARCHDPTEALLLRGFLEQEGIFCHIEGETHRQMLGVLGSYIEPRLLVPVAEARRASALIAEFRQTALVDEQQDPTQPPAFTAALPEQDGPYRGLAPVAGPASSPSPGRALTIGLLVGFGRGHAYAGARWRARLLALADAGTIAAMVAGLASLPFGLGLIGLLHLCDGVGAGRAAYDARDVDQEPDD